MQLLNTRSLTATCVGNARRSHNVPLRATVKVCACSSRREDPDAGDLITQGLSASRRSLLIGSAVLPLLGNIPLSYAAGGGYKKFLGYSQAPDLYMGYGQAKDAPPLYTFEYPADWTEEIPTKTEKSTMGMDGRVMHPKTRKEMAYVIALGGKDYRDSVLKDAKTSLIVVAGSDPDMRQALTDGEVQQAQKKINGTDMYVYDVKSDKRHYLSTIGKKGDTVFALVVTAPTSAFEKDAAGLKHIQNTFMLL